MATASAQETDPLQGEDVSVSFGDTTTSFGRAKLSFEDGAMRFRGRDWTMEGPENTLTGDALRVTVDGVSAETYAIIRASMVDAFESDSPRPLIAGFASAGIDSDASVRVVATSVEQDGELLADKVTATGSFGAVAPDGIGKLAEEDASLEAVDELGPSEWDQMTLVRGDTKLVLEAVVVTAHLPDAKAKARDTRFDVTLGEVKRGGETLVSDFETSGTLAELLQALPTKAEADGDADQERLPKVVIVTSSGGSGTYVFEVTGDLEKLEPNEDSGPAVDTVTDLGDRVRVEGAVTTGDDQFAFSGELIEVDVPEEVKLEIKER